VLFFDDADAADRVKGTIYGHTPHTRFIFSYVEGRDEGRADGDEERVIAEAEFNDIQPLEEAGPSGPKAEPPPDWLAFER
jgi:hypothetical protein